MTPAEDDKPFAITEVHRAIVDDNTSAESLNPLEELELEKKLRGVLKKYGYVLNEHTIRTAETTLWDYSRLPTSGDPLAASIVMLDYLQPQRRKEVKYEDPRELLDVPGVHDIFVLLKLFKQNEWWAIAGVKSLNYHLDTQYGFVLNERIGPFPGELIRANQPLTDNDYQNLHTLVCLMSVERLKGPSQGV